MVGLTSLIPVYQSLGLINEIASNQKPHDVSRDAITAKAVHTEIAIALGGDSSIQLVALASLCANTLDAYFETGEIEFLLEAERLYQDLLSTTPSCLIPSLMDRVASACTYFYYERDMRRRVQQGEQFLLHEAVEYIFRRGADCPIYTTLLQADNIWTPTLTACLRGWQALWDIHDDLRDVKMDIQTPSNCNILLLTNGDTNLVWIRVQQIMDDLTNLNPPAQLLPLIEQEYEAIRTVIGGR